MAFVKAFFVKAAMKNPLPPEKMLQNIATHRKDEYPNICLLVSLLSFLSGSNSTVERASSVLTLMLSERRLYLLYETMEDLLLIKCTKKIGDARKEKILWKELLKFTCQKGE